MSSLASLPDSRVAIVTGGADGIGWATAKRLSQDFAHVVIADLRADTAMQKALELGSEHLGIRCDVSREEDVVRMVRTTVERFGRIDAVVNNAGIGEQPAMTLEQTVEGFDRVLAVHLRGTFLVSRETARIFIAQGHGAIVNVSSIAGHMGHPGRNAYGAAKAGISTMTEAMASEWARDGVRVNAVAPGYVLTDLLKNLIGKGLVKRATLEDNAPMGRCGQPEEIAEAIAFLASPRASFITGVTLPVDGGWLAYGGHPATLATVAERRGA